jgi:hypothetical protein
MSRKLKTMRRQREKNRNFIAWIIIGFVACLFVLLRKYTLPEPMRSAGLVEDLATI